MEPLKSVQYTVRNVR